ncbi:hypothetical protein BDF19DRAFT_288539 [Syncephalis fuscata]|nr:hypothetical protein BDF19DRAFT_288539 [Syncephalis fuscata]
MEAITLHACQSDDPLNELSFAKGDLLIADDGWYEATLGRTGERGLVPCNYVKIITEKKAPPKPPVRKKKPVIQPSDNNDTNTAIPSTTTINSTTHTAESGIDTDSLPHTAFGVVLRPTRPPPPSTTTNDTAVVELPTKSKRPAPPPPRKSSLAHQPSNGVLSELVSSSTLSHQTSNNSFDSSITMVDSSPMPSLPPRPLARPQNSEPSLDSSSAQSIRRASSASFPPPRPPKPSATLKQQQQHIDLPRINGIANETLKRYVTAFDAWDRDKDGYLDGYEVRAFWRQSRLNRTELRKIWTLADRDTDGRLNHREFCIGTWLIDERLRGQKIPNTLPVTMIFE